MNSMKLVVFYRDGQQHCRQIHQYWWYPPKPEGTGRAKITFESDDGLTHVLEFSPDIESVFITADCARMTCRIVNDQPPEVTHG